LFYFFILILILCALPHFIFCYRRSSILGIRVKREFGENETKIQDGSRVTSEHRGLEPMVEDIGPSKQAPADANAMAIDEPGNVKNEPESSTKLPDQPAMYHKP
jgi:histone deacetylase 1/2